MFFRLFRKYQKVFFVTVAVLIVGAFVVTPVFTTLAGTPKVKEVVMGTGVTGKPMLLSDIEAIARMIQSDRLDSELIVKGGLPNYFNDGVIRKDFIATKLAVPCVKAYFEEIKGELNERIKSHKRYSPYAHPQASFLCAENVWRYAAPGIKERLDAFSQVETGDVKAVSLLCDLYLNCSFFPSHMLRHYLLEQQKQFSWVQNDQILERGDLAVFGAHSLDEWFGPSFVRLFAQVIYNGALKAVEKGYVVSYGEARSNLMKNGHEGLKMYNRKKSISSDELMQAFSKQVKSLGLHEESAVKAWQNVMLFRRMLRDEGRSAFVDPLMYENFLSKSQESAQVELYRFPQELKLGSFEDFMKLQVYSEAVSDDQDTPMTFLSVDAVEKQASALVQKRYLVDVKHVDTASLECEVGVVEMWEWEASHFSVLKAQFRELEGYRCGTHEERMQALESVGDEVGKRIDAYARKEIVKLHPEWIDAAFERAQSQKVELAVAISGGKVPLEGVNDRKAFIAWLDRADAGVARVYSQEPKHHYQISVIDATPSKEVMTFAEANKSGALDDLLDMKLSMAYPAVRSKAPFTYQDKEGNWKALEEVRGDVGRVVFANKLKAFSSEYDIGIEDVGALAAQGLRSFMEKAQKAIAVSGNEEAFLHSTLTSVPGKCAPRAPLSHQWYLEKESVVCQKSSPHPHVREDVYSLADNAYSDVALSAAGDISFYKRVGHGENSADITAKILDGHTILSTDQMRYVMQGMIQEMKEKDAIHLTSRETL